MAFPLLAALALRSAPLTIQANDNRAPAGRLAGDSLVLDLEVVTARWFPESDQGPSVEVAAFREAGKAPSIPGPLVRVRTGTTIIATISNRLPDSTLTVHGLGTRPGFKGREFKLPPGERRTIRFSAGEPGTYFYWAESGAVKETPSPPFTAAEREQLAGAFIVDPAEGSPPDRVLVINIWGRQLDSLGYRNALAINGKSWPHTERMTATVGDSIRWRVINASLRAHPMHLHGVYFRVDSKGDGLVDTTYDPVVRRLVVTEVMEERQTMNLVWRPDRPGNWLFHCHLMFHALHTARLDRTGHDAHSADADKHMAGLVLGISARPRPGDPVESRANARQLRLHVLQGPPRGRSRHAMSFVLENGQAPAADSVSNPGSPLILTRGQPTDITVLNRMPEATSVHWHGIELESWSDGVPGWSGAEHKVAPAIAAGDSFVARLTLPRAGTFMYHTHLNDIEQVTSGLYGPIIVLEPGQRYDPATDHTFLLSWSGEGEPPRFLVNGDSLPRTLKLKAGVAHRFRFINIAPAARPPLWLVRDSIPQRWRAIAKDGADLPSWQRVVGPARVRADVGETYDFEWTPPGPGEYAMRTGPRRSILVYQILVE